MDFPGRVIKLGETDAALVTAIASKLLSLGYQNNSPAGVFDKDFASLVKLFQTQNVDPLGHPLKADGQIGPVTWAALFGAKAAAEPAGAPSLGVLALREAIARIGVMEKPLGSNSGPEVDTYLRSVGLPTAPPVPGPPWCMSFVNFCIQTAAAAAHLPNSFPKTGGCIDAWNKVKKAQPAQVITKAQAIAKPSLVVPGVVFILDHGGGHGHTGFVETVVGGSLRTVEGNTNNDGSSNGVGVFRLTRRNIMDQALKGFLIPA